MHLLSLPAIRGLSHRLPRSTPESPRLRLLLLLPANDQHHRPVLHHLCCTCQLHIYSTNCSDCRSRPKRGKWIKDPPRLRCMIQRSNVHSSYAVDDPTATLCPNPCSPTTVSRRPKTDEYIYGDDGMYAFDFVTLPFYTHTLQYSSNTLYIPGTVCTAGRLIFITRYLARRVFFYVPIKRRRWWRLVKARPELCLRKLAVWYFARHLRTRSYDMVIRLSVEW